MQNTGGAVVSTVLEAARVAAIDLLRQARTVLLISHLDPDPDTLGSALGLAGALRAAGKTCQVACPTYIGHGFDYLPGIDEVSPVPETPEGGYDVGILLDSSDLGRFRCPAYEALTPETGQRARTISIDHHPDHNGFADVNVLHVGAAATAEEVYHLIGQMGLPLDRNGATCLLAGILGDTYMFQHQNATASALAAAAGLVALGASTSELATHMFRQRSLHEVRMWAAGLASVQTHARDRIIVAGIRAADRHRIGGGVPWGLITFLSEVTGVVAAVLLVEQDDGSIRASIRATEALDASAVAMVFGGGGHHRASGCMLPGPLEQARDRLLAEIRARWRK